MSSEIEYNFWRNFLDIGRVQQSKVPKKVLNSSMWKNLYNELPTDAILTTDRTSNGRSYIINEQKRNVVESSFKSLFPNHNGNIQTKAQSQAAFRSSKAVNVEDQAIFFIRGFVRVEINGVEYPLEETTNKFNIAAFMQPTIKCDKICWVENKDSFLIAEKLLGNDYVFLHKYGRIGEKDFHNIGANEILFCPDYDYVGLDEYLKVKAIHSNTTLFMPDNYDYLLKNVSDNLPIGQVETERVKQSNDSLVVKIREELKRGKFLEQNILFEL